MSVDLGKLNSAVEFLISRNTFSEKTEQLTNQIKKSRGAFVWCVLDLSSIEAELPEGIKSGWIFVLKKDVSSGCHYHPNSIQHMVTIRGEGISRVAGETRRMVRFGSSNASTADQWLVIDRGVPHEFFPEKEDMIVMSFHTCEADKLEEIDCETGEKRLYEEQAEPPSDKTRQR